MSRSRTTTRDDLAEETVTCAASDLKEAPGPADAMTGPASRERRGASPARARYSGTAQAFAVIFVDVDTQIREIVVDVRMCCP
jgi:hypothetical protein